jgi:Galactose oxidase, central domain
MSERWLWTQKEDIGPSARWQHGMAYEDVRQRVVLFGGWGGVETLGDTWEWDGSAWTQIADMGPPGRYSPGMTYDVSRQCVVLFGGSVWLEQWPWWVTLGDTWEWNGTEWTQVADIGPPPRLDHTMTYDAIRQRVVLYGGDADAYGGQPFGDTWEWDGTEWTQIADTGPFKRRLHAMVFDRSRECLVLFGGVPGNGPFFGDTWEWDNDAGWVKRQDMGPRDIYSPKMASTGEHTILFGTPWGAATSQTWEWDGRLWTQRQNMGPRGRYFHDLAYDSQRDRVVLFGGQVGSGAVRLGDTWELTIIEQ